MSINYTFSSDWIGRDSQPDTSPLRVIKAADFLTEWQAIQTAFTSAAPTASPTFTGTVTATNVQTTTLNSETANPANWNTAYGWGDHASAGYALDADVPANDGTGATGTWGINISGSAATAALATDCSRSVLAGTNLTGGGDLSGDVTLSLSDSPSVTSVILGNFTLIDSGTDLLVQYNGTSVFKITSVGAMVAANEVTAFGTP